MTDDQRLDPPHDGPDGTWFRSQLDPIVGAPPTAPDGLATITARAAAGAPLAPRSTRPRRLLLASAAAIVVAMVAVAITTADDPSSSVGTAGPATEEPATGETTSASPTTTTPETTTSTTTTPHESGQPVVSGPATTLPAPEQPTSYRDLTGLEVRLEAVAPEVRSGQALDADLLWTNTTAEEIVVNECTSLLTQSGMVSVNDPDGPLPGRVIIDCYDTPTITVPPGQTVRTEVSDGLVARHASRDTIGAHPWAGTLDAGPHLAVVLIPGSTSTLRIELPIEVEAPPCPTTTADLDRYVGRTEAEARAAAAQTGDLVRIAAIDGRPQGLTRDLRCDRINLDVSGGQVWDALRY